MKISEMLQREDFYDILPKTLNRYANFLGIEQGSVEVLDKGMEADMYANERLNAIISAKPSNNVKDYLKTEYAVNGSMVRKSMVSAYLTASTMLVKRCAQRGLNLKSSLPLNDVLIYPCNKKIRLFDFSTGVVYTVLKEGFPDIYIKRETAFRLNAKAKFVPRIVESGNGCYSEVIIKKGKPLARIRDVVYVEEKKQESLRLLSSLSPQPREVMVKAYIDELKERCRKMLATKGGFAEVERTTAIFDRLQKEVQDCRVGLVMSHGDFQPGNIWIDEEGEIIIIDWETVKERSPYYDYAALYCSLRNHGGMKGFCERVLSDKHLSDVEACPAKTVLTLILAEELEYQTEELISFPGKMGVNMYIDKLIEFETVV